MKSQRSLGQYALIGLILGLFFYTVLPILSPVILGLLVALVIYPLHTGLKKLSRLPNIWSALVVSLLVTTIFVLPVVFIGISVVNQGLALAGQFTPDEVLKSYDRLIQHIPLRRDLIEESLKAILGNAGSYATKTLTAIVSSLPRLAVEAAFFVVALYYGLVDGPRLASFLIASVPFTRDEAKAMAETTEQISRGVVLGSLISGLLQGCIVGTAYAFLGVPGALLFGTLTALLSFVPALGSGPTGLGGAAYLWSQGNNSGALIMLVALGIAGTVDNIVKPWVLKGGRASLHPLLALISAIGGLSVFGISGIFLGPLIAALTVVVLTVTQNQNAQQY